MINPLLFRHGKGALVPARSQHLFVLDGLLQTRTFRHPHPVKCFPAAVIGLDMGILIGFIQFDLQLLRIVTI